MGRPQEYSVHGDIGHLWAGKGVVVSTGMNTELGMIATMLQQVENEQTPLQNRLDGLGKVLGYGSLIVCGLVFVIGVIRYILGPEYAGFFSTATLDQFRELFIVAVPWQLPLYQRAYQRL